MTDKEKFRKEVEKLKSNLIYGACSSQVAMETRCKEEAYDEVLAILDTMQEEPVSIWHNAREKSNKPESVVIINHNDYSGDVIPNCIGVNEGNLWACTSDLLNIENSCNFGKNLQELEEPVSEDLEKASKKWLKPQLDKSYADYGEVKMMELTHFDGYAMLDAIEFGAKWQKEKDESTIELAEDHAYFAGRTKTIDEIKEALLSEVLPCFMHGGEADEVVAKLDEVLNQKK